MRYAAQLLNLFTIVFIFKRKVGTSNAQQPLLKKGGR
jgi:hypothetical protein